MLPDFKIKNKRRPLELAQKWSSFFLRCLRQSGVFAFLPPPPGITERSEVIPKFRIIYFTFKIFQLIEIPSTELSFVKLHQTLLS